MTRLPDPELALAVASLDDRHAAEATACIEILKMEADLDRRRVAQRRFLDLTDKEN